MKKLLLMVGLSILALQAQEFNAPMQTYMQALSLEAKNTDSTFNGFDAKRGETLFQSKHMGKKGVEISCTTCHTINLKNNGQNVNTNKSILPLAPSVNTGRLSDVKEVEKWLRRNFNDVLNREGTAREKGDVLSYIITQ
ncbi:MAG: DUF1924 domain-containing protein [Sulfurospirillaceae bacterium]|nr:DUF1924 domain-containing protein [Sulfurospirillaceae bacterium]MDD2825661.1 DUF1924 domain-containing protein [Sulfurospirillaceae bacterium]